MSAIAFSLLSQTLAYFALFTNSFLSRVSRIRYIKEKKKNETGFSFDRGTPGQSRYKKNDMRKSTHLSLEKKISLYFGDEMSGCNRNPRSVGYRSGFIIIYPYCIIQI